MKKQPQNRSEKTRQRREQKSRRPARKRRWRRKPVSSLVQMPPVFVRGDNAGVARRQRKNSKTRPRYDVSLGTLGAELRLPSLPRFRLGWRLVSGLLVFGFAGLLYYFWYSPDYRVNVAEGFGLQRLENRDINLVLALADMSVFALDRDKMRRDLMEAFPEFASVDVRVGLPNVVQVFVEERQPRLAWQGSNWTVWVDEEGVAFPPRGEVDTLPVIVGPETPPTPTVQKKNGDIGDGGVAARQMLNSEMVSAILDLNKTMPEETALLYDPDHGLGWEDPQGWQVYFGTTDTDMDEKLQVYLILVDRLIKENIQPTLISVEHLYAPYYRLVR